MWCAWNEQLQSHQLSLSHPFEAWQMFLPALLPMNKGKHESYEGRGGRKPKLAVAVASREDGSCKRGEGLERVGQGGLAVVAHDGLQDVNVVSHIIISCVTYS